MLRLCIHAGETEDADVELSAMEYFILALIGRANLTSLYDFQQKAGLQPGGIRSALKRLEEFGLIHRAESSTRRRRNLSLSLEGVRFLNNSWQRSLQGYPDSESVLRAAAVALLMNDEELAARYLEGMAFSRRHSAEEKTMIGEQLRMRAKEPLSTYIWMRSLCEAQRHSAESVAFAALGQFLKEKTHPDVVEQP
jgi:DNA-binding MarR family transcriptional regulator